MLYGSMTLLFYFLAPLQNDTIVTSWCMQFNFGDKGEATCLIRECPSCVWKRRDGRGEKQHQSLDKIWTCKPWFILLTCTRRVQRIKCVCVINPYCAKNYRCESALGWTEILEFVSNCRLLFQCFIYCIFLYFLIKKLKALE